METNNRLVTVVLEVSDLERSARLYRDADVGVVTPLRDGMNLVAKEFVACQVANPGVLVLSRTAGAAHTMPEALLVNPYDEGATADVLHRALGMGIGERETRMAALREREQRWDVHAWAASFLEAAGSVDDEHRSVAGTDQALRQAS